MDYITHNCLWFYAAQDSRCAFQEWVFTLPLDLDFEYADGPLDAPIGRYE
jgi:hypothetical protein